MVKLTLRLIDLRFSLPIERVLGDRNVRIAVKLGEINLRLLLQRDKLALVELQRIARLVVDLASDAVAEDQRGVAVEGDLIERDLRLLCGDIAQRHLVVGLHRLDGEADLVQIG